MSAKRTSWNEFSSSITSAVICLSSGGKFNFSKYIFDSLVRNVDSTTKFYMYPRFLQLIIRKQVDEEEDADENVEEVNAGDAAEGDVKVMDACAAFTRRVEHLEFDKAAQALEITKLKRMVKKPKKRNNVRKLNFRRLQRLKWIRMMLLFWWMIRRRIGSAIITTTEAQVPAATLTAAPTRVSADPSRRRKGVVIRDPESESTTSTIIPAETKSKDKGKGILLEEPKP
nr:synaptobrevin, longin-like domain protein [Tanacetum cinerariifolium]